MIVCDLSYLMKKYLFLIVLIILLGINFPFIKVLSISSRKDFSERLYSRSALNGFCISYTHSVNKGRVHDFYHVLSSDELELFMTEFVSYGAGIPEPEETAGAKFYSNDNTYVLSDINRKLPNLLMAVGLIADHSISFGKNVMDGMNFSKAEEFFLKDFFKPQTSLVFEVKRVSVLKFLYTRKLENKNE